MCVYTLFVCVCMYLFIDFILHGYFDYYVSLFLLFSLFNSTLENIIPD